MLLYGGGKSAGGQNEQAFRSWCIRAPRGLMRRKDIIPRVTLSSPRVRWSTTQLGLDSRVLLPLLGTFRPAFLMIIGASASHVNT